MLKVPFGLVLQKATEVYHKCYLQSVRQDAFCDPSLPVSRPLLRCEHAKNSEKKCGQRRPCLFVYGLKGFLRQFCLLGTLKMPQASTMRNTVYTTDCPLTYKWTAAHY